MTIGLIIQSDKSGREKLCYLSRNETTLGRGEQADVVLNDKSVSREHAVIRRCKEGYLLLDCESRNGTRVNGVTIIRRHLRDGDRLMIGDVQLLFHEVEPDDHSLSANVPSNESSARLSDDELLSGPTVTHVVNVTRNGSDPGAVHAWQIVAALDAVSGSADLARVLRVIVEDFAGMQNVRRVILYLSDLQGPGRPLWIKAGLMQSRPEVFFSEDHILQSATQGTLIAAAGGKIQFKSQDAEMEALYLPIMAAGQRAGCLYLEGQERLSRDAVQVARLAAKAISVGIVMWRSAEGIGNLQGKVSSLNPVIIGKSRVLQDAVRLALKAAQSDATVLIRGETGTGKELFAMLVVEESSRKTEPFIPVHCSAIEETLLGSALFGHEKGAFTGAVGMKKGFFEEANGGTIFLDEIGELNLNMQVKLLRVLQGGEIMKLGGNRPIHVNVRIIAATNRNLESAVKEGLFREDLYYRLKVLDLYLPPLRERREDISELVRHFVEELGSTTGKSRVDISKETMNVLERYHWPGNARELRNVIERCLVLSDTATITVDDLPAEIKMGAVPSSSMPLPLESSCLKSQVSETERRHIEQVIKECNGNKRAAAQRLGISRSTLYEKLHALAGQIGGQPPP